MNILKGREGMALVLTLMVVALITALAVEFSYEIYVNTSSLYNYQTLQRLSLASKSATRLASKTISDLAAEKGYTYPGHMELKYDNPIEKAGGVVVIRAEDENSKFNINKIFEPLDPVEKKRYQSFKRLLRALELDEEIADRVMDWRDPDSEPMAGASEDGAKNAPLDSADEIFLIKGIKREDAEKLLPYVTVYGNGLININGAEAPVLMSLSNNIDRGMAERVIAYRENTRFEKAAHITKVAGFEELGTSLGGYIGVRGWTFRIISEASSGNVRRIVECVFETPGFVKYWKET